AQLSRLVGSLGERKVRVLRRHFEELRARTEGAGGPTEECRLSFDEWRTLADAYALARLRDCSLDSFRGCLEEVGQERPDLAEKLGRLAAGQVALLYARVKTGKRWA
ncbi:MAG: hypothetical protein K2W96_18845, partial [Gemmataceae bacterium]|nr:hypothetical protein [Gemmataceae bacterium]